MVSAPDQNLHYLHYISVILRAAWCITAKLNETLQYTMTFIYSTTRLTSHEVPMHAEVSHWWGHHRLHIWCWSLALGEFRGSASIMPSFKHAFSSSPIIIPTVTTPSLVVRAWPQLYSCKVVLECYPGVHSYPTFTHTPDLSEIHWPISLLINLSTITSIQSALLPFNLSQAMPFRQWPWMKDIAWQVGTLLKIFIINKEGQFTYISG